MHMNYDHSCLASFVFVSVHICIFVCCIFILYLYSHLSLEPLHPNLFGRLAILAHLHICLCICVFMRFWCIWSICLFLLASCLASFVFVFPHICIFILVYLYLYLSLELLHPSCFSAYLSLYLRLYAFVNVFELCLIKSSQQAKPFLVQFVLVLNIWLRSICMQCCLPYLGHFCLSVSFFVILVHICHWMYWCIFIPIPKIRVRTPIKLCPADSLCLLNVSSLWPTILYFCTTVFSHFVFVYFFCNIVMYLVCILQAMLAHLNCWSTDLFCSSPYLCGLSWLTAPLSFLNPKTISRSTQRSVLLWDLLEKSILSICKALSSSGDLFRYEVRCQSGPGHYPLGMVLVSGLTGRC